MTAPDLPALLEPIQERLDAATPGPWVIGKDRMERAILAGPYKAFLIAKVGDVRNPLLEDNAKLIANAPTDTARLLAAVKAVTEMHRREVIAVHEGHGEEATCTECGHYWPCPTVSAVEAALGEA